MGISPPGNDSFRSIIEVEVGGKITGSGPYAFGPIGAGGVEDSAVVGEGSVKKMERRG